MIFITVLALILGIFVGAGIDSPIIAYMVEHNEIMLYILMFFVGISIGHHKGIMNELKKYKFKIFLIPFGIIIGSLFGGLICSFIVGHDLNDSLAIASGLGWYSLAGIAIADLAGAELGSIAFLSNILRELLTFLVIPFIAKYMNDYACIAPAGATSEDTALPMLIKYTRPAIVVLAIFNGIVCTIAVPIIISMCYMFS